MARKQGGKDQKTKLVGTDDSFRITKRTGQIKSADATARTN
jgi:hypothetical protein